jgi:hypothetical protein
MGEVTPIVLTIYEDRSFEFIIKTPPASELLKKAISLDVQTLGYQFLPKAGTHIPMVVVNTKVTTTAGHRIPDG